MLFEESIGILSYVGSFGFFEIPSSRKVLCCAMKSGASHDELFVPILSYQAYLWPLLPVPITLTYNTTSQ